MHLVVKLTMCLAIVCKLGSCKQIQPSLLSADAPQTALSAEVPEFEKSTDASNHFVFSEGMYLHTDFGSDLTGEDEASWEQLRDDASRKIASQLEFLKSTTVPNHFVFVLDASASMSLFKDFHNDRAAEENTPWGSLRMTIFKFLDALHKSQRYDDTFEIVIFRVFGDHGTRCEVGGSRCHRTVMHPNTAYGSKFHIGRDQDMLLNYDPFFQHVIGDLDRDELGRWGGTQFYTGLEAARSLVVKARATTAGTAVPNTHVLFVSDGESQQRGEIADCARVIRDLAQNHDTTVDVIFFESEVVNGHSKQAAMADLNTMATNVHPNVHLRNAADLQALEAQFLEVAASVVNTGGVDHEAKMRQLMQAATKQLTASHF